MAGGAGVGPRAVTMQPLSGPEQKAAFAQLDERDSFKQWELPGLRRAPSVASVPPCHMAQVRDGSWTAGGH